MFRFRGLLGSSKPVMLMTALVAILGITGTAYGAKLITGLDIRDGSITAVDLSKGAQATLRGDTGGKGDKGLKGAKGDEGDLGRTGATGAVGATGATGNQGAVGAQGAQGSQGPQGTQGSQGSVGNTGAASTVAGPPGSPGGTGGVGPAGPGTTQGSVCTVPGGLTGTIHWSNPGGSTWTMS